jgi:hypothetical protein
MQKTLHLLNYQYYKIIQILLMNKMNKMNKTINNNKTKTIHNQMPI